MATSGNISEASFNSRAVPVPADRFPELVSVTYSWWSKFGSLQSFFAAQDIDAPEKKKVPLSTLCGE